MGKPLMIQEDDEKRILALKAELPAKTKIQVVREGLSLLEIATERRKRVERWKKAVARTAKESRRVNRDFLRHSRLRRLAE